MNGSEFTPLHAGLTIRCSNSYYHHNIKLTESDVNHNFIIQNKKRIVNHITISTVVTRESGSTVTCPSINPINTCTTIQTWVAHTLIDIYENNIYHHTIIRAAFVCLSVCLFVPLLLRGPMTDLRQTCWVYVGGP